MGLLRNLSSHRDIPLGSRVLVGRSPSSVLHIDDPRVSGEHASMWWDDGWHVRDLGSSNGTWVGSQRLGAGETARLPVGAHLGFGTADGAWELVDGGPPGLLAVAGDLLVAGHAALLVLPDDEHPVVSVFSRGGKWVVEGDGEAREVAHGDTVVVGDQAFTLLIPGGVPRTWSTAEQAWSLATACVELTVSRDREVVQMALTGPPGRLELGSRAHHHLLWLLARQRVDDVDLVEAERGWILTELLQQQLGVGELALNVQVHRARRQLGRAGVLGAASVVERRVGTGQLRLGAPILRIIDSSG